MKLINKLMEMINKLLINFEIDQQVVDRLKIDQQFDDQLPEFVNNLINKLVDNFHDIANSWKLINKLINTLINKLINNLIGNSISWFRVKPPGGSADRIQGLYLWASVSGRTRELIRNVLRAEVRGRLVAMSLGDALRMGGGTGSVAPRETSARLSSGERAGG